jgi:AraC-like DNA-binding protein
MRPSRESVPSSPYLSWHHNIRREPRFAFDWHYHPEYELTLIVSGSGRRYVGDRVDEYAPGDLVLVGAETPHTWESGEAAWHEAVTLQFQHDVFGAGLFSRPEFQRVQRLLDRTALGLRFTGAGAEDIATVMLGLSDLDPARRSVRLLEILVSLSELDAAALATHSLITRVDAAARRRIDLAIGYVHRDYAGEVSVRRAAALVSMTPDAFSRFFRVHTGRTFTDYVNDVRLAEACRRLVEEEDSAIGDISAGCGYQNLSHFNRRFRLRNGMSPREFRRHFRADGRTP